MANVPDWAKDHGKINNDKESSEDYVVYGGSTAPRTLPRAFKPHGTFRALEQKGTLHTAENYKAKIKSPPKGKMPGYTGYIRGKTHIYGRSFGTVTRMASETTEKERLENPPVPLGPQYEIPTLDTTRLEKIRSAQQNAYPVPGFSARSEACPDNSGRAKQELKELEHGAQITTKFRQTISSDPVPGQTRYEVPRKVVPRNMAHVKYISK
mmetsp:Transcript_20181/g.28157  ORF Transcript_20181/g.28157 Transcript_20181/m.28157 type:complete len:210 (-) Transcript_20181:180-809(-)|eukprot:CAMPEP_0184478492 /NCGR_PEP_ID=MMETSP0113_2-20130426/505_1 /TAXON_ID=91329 /ORGANISM="Norrisiella sphaerica, Strain BC52" /LENGTH=209 /DNA_ID=CAMNT_0026856301 /DNA_START=137 /DNA_END=766 /DNA_ORIENTATION=+